MKRTAAMPPPCALCHAPRGRAQIRWLAGVLVAALLATLVLRTFAAAEVLRPPFPNGKFALTNGYVVAFLGGADVASSQSTGHLEALLAEGGAGQNVRFRNFGWEGDTVFAQPRDVGFPPLSTHLERAHATVVFLQFGRTEAMNAPAETGSFIQAYARLLDTCARQTPRLILVTPPPYEKGDGLFPDLRPRNAVLEAYAGAIRQLARSRGLPCLDVFQELGGTSHGEPRLTDNGLQLTARGHAAVAAALVRQLGWGTLVERAGKVSSEGAWANPAMEKLRLAVVEKNRLWFEYWRPQNWAFLGGDRTTQPSSRDHRDPSVRWFPAEMERFVPLIDAQEKVIQRLAGQTP
jgi:hypothetical protein